MDTLDVTLGHVHDGPASPRASIPVATERSCCARRQPRALRPYALWIKSNRKAASESTHLLVEQTLVAVVVVQLLHRVRHEAPADEIIAIAAKEVEGGELRDLRVRCERDAWRRASLSAKSSVRARDPGSSGRAEAMQAARSSRAGTTGGAHPTALLLRLPLQWQLPEGGVRACRRVRTWRCAYSPARW